jgi:hypothetical protein
LHEVQRRTYGADKVPFDLEGLFGPGETELPSAGLETTLPSGNAENLDSARACVCKFPLHVRNVVLDNRSVEVVPDGDSYFVGGLSSFEGVESMARDLFNNQWKYQDRNDPYARPWPESAANRFGKQPWCFDPPLSLSSDK